jgi:hypothetical protein
MPGNYSGTQFRIAPRLFDSTGLRYGLENQRSESFRGFESRPLRSNDISRTQPRKCLQGWSGISPEGGLEGALLRRVPRRLG